MSEKNGSSPVTKYELQQFLEERDGILTVELTTSIRDLVNGNLKALKQDIENKNLKQDQRFMELINQIQQHHTDEMNKMNLIVVALSTASETAHSANTRLFKLTDNLKDVKIPELKAEKDKEMKEINEHINQERGAAKFRIVMVGLIGSVGALAGLFALFR